MTFYEKTWHRILTLGVLWLRYEMGSDWERLQGTEYLTLYRRCSSIVVEGGEDAIEIHVHYRAGQGSGALTGAMTTPYFLPKTVLLWVAPATKHVNLDIVY